VSGVIAIQPQQETGEAAELPEIYFDPPDKYWTRGRNGVWFRRGTADIKRLMKSQGITSAQGRGYLSELDQMLVDIQEENNIRYAGPLAGFAEGIHNIQGDRVLITRGPIMIEPVEGEWPLLESIFRNMLGVSEDRAQLDHFYGWLNFSLVTLRARVDCPHDSRGFFPGQALGLVGEKGAAKSLTQSIITELLGGRSARPYQAMLGGTTFNGDWFEAEHLCIEDEAPSTDLRTRRSLGNQIKQVTVNEMHRCHRKHREPIMLPPFWRLTLSLNDDPEHLMVLPPLDESLSDKIMLLKCRKHDMPMPTGTPADKKTFFDALLGELPAFTYSLLNEWTLPEGIESDRFGVQHYHHPEILQALSVQSPEQRLLDLIEMEFFSSSAPSPMEKRATDIEKELTRWDGDCRHAAGKLLNFPSAMGTYLGRLSKSHPKRVQKGAVRDGTQYWVLNPLF
jgi:hypothetical protein